MKTEIAKIFPSIQQEGIYIGERQIFVRFCKCNLSCTYCDTLPLKGEKLSEKDVLDKIDKLNKFPNLFHSISLTGGEPLLDLDFLLSLLPEIKKRNLKIYLETNGTLPEEMSKLISLIDFVSMDIKLPSTCGGKYFEQHKEFLKLISFSLDNFVKVVIAAQTTKKEFEKAINLIASENKDLFLVIQPVTEIRGIKSPSPQKLLNFQEFAKKYLNRVRIIPQIQTILKME